MYAPIEDARLSQGDIITNVPFAYIPDLSDPALYVEGEPVERDLTQPFNPEEALTILAQAHKSSVLILEPSCNIDNKDYICAARIFPLSDYDTDYRGMTNQERIAKYLRRQYQDVGVQPNVYYLQESPEHHFPKSLASFLELHTIRKTTPNLDYLLRNRVLRLNTEALGDLQYRIGFFFGRYATETENYMLTDEERAVLRPARRPTEGTAQPANPPREAE
ncbi:MAG: hypothetical protein ACJ754_01140 [Pyrinomonadaceae bacterium]